MKKQYLTIAIIGAAILALGFGSFAYAQTQTPDPYPYGMMGEGGSYGDHMLGEGYYGQGMMDEGGFGHNMMGGGMGMMGNHGEMSALHDYMFPAIAEALSLTPEEFQARHDAGETFWDIADAQGFSEEEAWDLMEEAREKAFEQAVADGIITEEFADHMEDHHEEGGGREGGHCGGDGLDGLEL